MKNLVIWLALMFVFTHQAIAINKISRTPNFKEPAGQMIPIEMMDIGNNLFMPSVAIGRISDGDGREVMHSIFGEMTVGERTDYINVAFQYSISDFDVRTFLSGTGSTDHVQSSAEVHTGTGVGSSRLLSVSKARYVTGHEMVIMFTADYSEPEINVEQKVGFGDAINGFAGFGYDGTVFGIWLQTLEAGLVHIPQDTWNLDKVDGVDPSGHTLNPNSYNLYMIRYGWGTSPIAFSIYGGADKGWIQVHVFDNTNEAELPHLNNASCSISMMIERTSGTGADLKLKSSAWRGSIVGQLQKGTLADRNHVIKIVTTVTGSGVPIWTLRSKAFFQGVINDVRTRIATVDISTDGVKAVTFDIFRGGVLVGGVFVDTDTQNSVTEHNITATSYTPPAGFPLAGLVLGKVDAQRIGSVGGDVSIPIYGGESITIIGSTSAGTSEVILYIRHVEEF